MQRKSNKRVAAVLVLAGLTACARISSAADLRNVLTGYTLTAWSQKDGLPSGTVYALAQDSEGYLWVGTNSGLFRFDGLHFLAWDAFGRRPLAGKAVRTLLMGHDGALWVGFADEGGISRIRGTQVRSYGPSDGLLPGAITAVVEDARGRVWAGNAEGLFRLDREHWEQWPAGRGLPTGPITSAHATRDGRLLVGSASGLYELPRGQEAFKFLEANRDVPRSIAEDAAGIIFVTDPISGFRRVGDPATEPDSLERGRGRQLLFDTRSNLWVGTAGQGLWRAHKKAGQQSAMSTERATALTGLLADGVISLLEDHEGNIWAGTTEGLNRFAPHRVMQVTNLGLVAGVEVTSNGQVWVGTVDAIARFRSKGGDLAPLRTPLPNNPLRAIHADRDGTVWIATNRYVARVAPNGIPIRLPGAEGLNQVEAITSDSRGGVWMYDLGRGLVRWNGGRQLPLALPPGLDGVQIVTLYTDRARRIWLAFAQGQLASIGPDETIRTYGAQDGFEAGVCHAIYEDSRGFVWFAGTDGLSRFADGRFVTVHQGNGFPTDNLTAVVEDDADNLWIGTGSGIVRMNRGEFEKAIGNSSYRVQYSLYDRSDGLAGLPFIYSSNRRAVRAADGLLWFVTGRGLTIIDPRALRETPPPAPVRIETIFADDTTVDVSAGRPVLPPRTSQIEIDYTVLNLRSPLKTRFRYRLEGFDASWIEAGTRRQAFYTNLPPRIYRFRVMASSTEGDWHEPGDVIEFSILPMFYQTRWFYALAITALSLAIWGAWALRLRQVRRQFSMLIGERARLSREIHDTLLQSLVGVALQFDAMASDVESLSPQATNRFVRMRKQVEEYIREARQSIWDLRSPKLQRTDLVTALRDTCERTAADSGITLEFAVNGTPHRYSPLVEEQVLRIGQEAVTNAVRHGHPQRVNIEVAYCSTALTLRVADDGVGFDVSEERENHYGLVSMRERTEQVGGVLRIASRPGEGTEVRAVIPVAEHA